MLPRIIRPASEEFSRVSPVKFNTASNGGGNPAAPADNTSAANVWPVFKNKAAAGSVPGGGFSSTNVEEKPASIEPRFDSNPEQSRAQGAELEREGYEKGFSEGQKAAREATEKMADGLLKQYSASLEELNKLRRDIFSSSERQVIRLALEVARKIVKREVTVDDELILTLVRVALTRVSHQALVTIRVNPKDYISIDRHHAAHPGAGPLNETMKLVEDQTIARGGCVIETESGTVDARIEEQLREIEKGFFD